MSALGPILGAFGTMAGFGMQNARQHRSYMQQRQLMGLQYENQRKLNQQGYDMQMQMWKDTNYPAQMKMLKEAGLNPSLLYGMSGGGGTTTGSQGGGSASGGSAPAPMDLGGAIQLGMMASDIKLKKAQARDLDATAEGKEIENKVEKNFGANAKSAEYHNRLNEAKAQGKMLYGQWADGNGGYEWNGETVAENRAEEMIMNNYTLSEVEAELQKEKNKYVKESVMYEVLNAKLDAEVKEANIKLTDKQRWKIWHDVWQGWVNAGLKGLDTIVKGRLKDIGKGGK